MNSIMFNKEKSKVLFVVEAMGGGVFTYIVDLANELVEIYDICIAYAVRPQTPENYRTYFDARIQLIEVKNFERSITPKKDIKAFFEIRRIAKQVRPDIIHLHSSKAGVLGRLAFDGRKIPLFYTPHGYSFLMENCNPIKRLIYKTIETICGKKCCTTISCSEGEHQQTLQLTKHALYVNNGINIDELQKLLDSMIEDEAEHPFTVFTLGRICYQKNPQLFNEIALAMPDVQFVWIGDGELRNELNAVNIDITGWIDRNAALRYSMKGDVFLLSSLWEGLPMSLLEAMYMKKTCVVTNVIGNRDVIRTGENGFVCETVDDFVKAIRKAQEGHTGELVNRAYSDVLRVYNTNVMTKKYSQIYNSKIV